MDGVNYYQLFSLTPDGDLGELKSRYRRLSLEHHPDRGGSTEQMARLNEAYQTLSNPLLRREYDRRLAVAQPVAVASTYQYTRPRPSYATGAYTYRASRQAPREEFDQARFWRWFVVLALMGAAFIVYDILSTFVLPSLVREASTSSATSETAGSSSQDLSGVANSALNELPSAPTQSPSDSSSSTGTTPSSGAAVSPSYDAQDNSSYPQQLRRQWRHTYE